MGTAGRTAPLRRTGSLLGLLGLELAAVLGLHWLGRFPGLRIGWDEPVPWLLSSPVQEVLGALLRTVGLVMAYWLLASTLLYLLASLTRLPAAVRAVSWATVPVVRRVADHALAVTLATSVVGGGTLGAAGPALAADSRGGTGPPARKPVAAAQATTTTRPAGAMSRGPGADHHLQLVIDHHLDVDHHVDLHLDVDHQHDAPRDHHHRARDHDHRGPDHDPAPDDDHRGADHLHPRRNHDHHTPRSSARLAPAAGLPVRPRRAGEPPPPAYQPTPATRPRTRPRTTPGRAAVAVMAADRRAPVADRAGRNARAARRSSRSRPTRSGGATTSGRSPATTCAATAAAGRASRPTARWPSTGPRSSRPTGTGCSLATPT